MLDFIGDLDRRTLSVRTNSSDLNPKALNERQRHVIHMTAWGLSPREISKVTGYHIEHIYRLLATAEAQEMLSSFRSRIESTIADTVRDLVPEVLNGAGALG